MQIGIDEPQNAKPGTQSVFLSQGFRPFFLMAGIYAVLPIAAWLMSVVDVASLPGSFHGVAWHGHEMLFGFATAAVAGFLLTAVPSWTRTPPVQGGALAVLLVIWAAGRFAMWFGWPLGAGFVAAIDLLAIPALVFLAGQPILIQGLRRNYIVLGILGFLFFSNLLMHLEAMGATEDTANFGLRLGVFGFVLLLVLISGRVIPSFTANALRAKGIDYDVRSSPGFDKIVVLCLLAAILGDLFLNTDSGVGEKTSGYLSLLAAGALAVRMRHWGTFKSLGEPIVWVLHLGHAWIVFGFFLKGFADLTGMLPSGGAVHALTAGAMGTMIMAVMTRAALGHTGRTIKAPAPIVLAYLMVSLGTVIRILISMDFVGLSSETYAHLVIIGGTAWSSAFVLFVMVYWPILTRPRTDN